MESGCFDNTHLKGIDLYCLMCNKTCCGKCLKEHQQHPGGVKDIDDVYDECIESLDKMPSVLRELNKKNYVKKETNDLYFKTTIEDKLQNEIDKVTKFFKKLHEQFHNKEMELKENLAEYNKQNGVAKDEIDALMQKDLEDAERLIRGLSVDHGVGQHVAKDSKIQMIVDCLEAGRVLAKGKKEKEEEDVYNANIDNRKKVIMELLGDNDTSAEMKILESKSFLGSKYSQYMLTEPLNNIDMVLSTMELVDAEKLEENIYIYGSCFQKLNIGSKKLENISVLGDIFETPRSIFKSIVTTNDAIYVFKRKEYLKYDPVTTNWTKTAFGNSVNGGDWISAQYDGREYIYLFGGCHDTTNHSMINRFSTKTGILDYKFAQTRVPIRFQTTCMVGDQFIYTIDGVKSNYDEKESILEKFNVTTKELSVVKDFEELGYSDVIGMVYIESRDSLFLFCQHHQFFQYHLKTGHVKALATKEFGLKQCYVHLQYDERNTIYCISKDSIAEYNIFTNTWSRFNSPSFHPFDQHEYAICFTNKF